LLRPITQTQHPQETRYSRGTSLAAVDELGR
jgi:hypothetical protein